MQRDGLIWSIHAGILASVVYGVMDMIGLGLGVTNIPVWRVAAGIFLTPGQVETGLGTLIGWIGHIAVGGFWGLVLSALLRLSGRDGSVYKGLLLGLFIFLLDGLAMRLGATTYPIRGAVGHLWLAADSGLFGLTLGYLIPRLAAMPASGREYGWPGGLAQPAMKPDQDVDLKRQKEK